MNSLFRNLKQKFFTDVSGGNCASILDVMRSAIDMLTHLSMVKNESFVPLSYKKVFYFATLESARGNIFVFIFGIIVTFLILSIFSALSIKFKVGHFKPGKEFDALVIDLNSKDGRIDDIENYSLQEMLQMFIYFGDDHNIIEVYVSGKCVAKRL